MTAKTHMDIISITPHTVENIFRVEMTGLFSAQEMQFIFENLQYQHIEVQVIPKKVDLGD